MKKSDEVWSKVSIGDGTAKIRFLEAINDNLCRIIELLEEKPNE